MNQKFAHLFFEAGMLCRLQRSGYHFLGAGNESVAEHTFMTTFIAMAMAELAPGADGDKMVKMALVHDLAEARTGDLNYVHRQYATAHEDRALAHLARNSDLGGKIQALVREFNRAETLEARLVKDADQLSFVLELKRLQDIGTRTVEKWLPPVLARLKTEVGRTLAESLMATEWDAWWLDGYTEP